MRERGEAFGCRELEPDGCHQARAFESPDAELKKLGLVRAGSLYILETETAVQQKPKEAKALIAEYKNAFVHTLDIKFSATRAKEMDDFIIELDHDIDQLNVELRYRPAVPTT